MASPLIPVALAVGIWFPLSYFQLVVLPQFTATLLAFIVPVPFLLVASN